MTPLHLEFCLAFHWSPEPYRVLDVTYDSPAGKEIKAWMIAEKLIEDGENDTTWGQPTQRLRVFIEHLCAQPLPVQQWVMPS